MNRVLQDVLLFILPAFLFLLPFYPTAIMAISLGPGLTAAEVSLVLTVVLASGLSTCYPQIVDFWRYQSFFVWIVLVIDSLWMAYNLPDDIRHYFARFFVFIGVACMCRYITEILYFCGVTFANRVYGAHFDTQFSCGVGSVLYRAWYFTPNLDDTLYATDNGVESVEDQLEEQQGEVTDVVDGQGSKLPPPYSVPNY